VSTVKLEARSANFMNLIVLRTLRAILLIGDVTRPGCGARMPMLLTKSTGIRRARARAS
jgi:hypothetical protein